jgi:transaldolase
VSGLLRLAELGQSPWYDNLSRTSLEDGSIQSLLDRGVLGITSNPSIFEQALASGSAYDRELIELASRGLDVAATYWEIVVQDISNACRMLRPIYDATEAADGFVSVEVDPNLSGDPAATVRMARDLVNRIAEPNLMIKVPATIAGLEAMTELLAEGISVNATLIFGPIRYSAVIEAFQRGLTQQAASGNMNVSVASVASFFISRVDSAVDALLPSDASIRGHVGVANAKVAYQMFLDAFKTEEWVALSRLGYRPQRPLWASTSTKNPAYSELLYVDTLIGDYTVNTLAPASIAAIQRANTCQFRANSILDQVDEAEAIMAALPNHEIDFGAIEQDLEQQGIAAFRASYTNGLSTLAERLSVHS